MARTDPAPPAETLAVDDIRIAAVVAGFHRAVAESLLDGAILRLGESGLAADRVDVHWIPGAYEAPAAAAALAATGRYAAIMALGAVIRGETAHFEYVCDAAASGLMRVSLDTGVPCAFGILTCDSTAQAEARAGGDKGNKGDEAADAVVAMINLLASARAMGPGGASRS
ncbi:MAG: 6,7-dimethyl-8-ribityllumazine synthase [Actinobacteria bacterium]|nr:6,7-dimethyl-8-ribityllumazine synthase [Actinomycetota bacterium]MBM3697466.1 6,7-dimethyl-8-ribityllumazine synthase [Actinomycetota bacterium]